MNFKELLSLEEEKVNWKLTLLLIIIAYTFSVSVRYVYISYVGDIPQFQWQGHLMINNNDGYYYAEGARDILAGFHQTTDLSPVNTPAAILTAFLAKFLPFIPFDVLIEFLPGFLGSLIVIPIILIGRVLGSTWMGFLAGLLGGIAWSYYHRTMFGYYDTDMLVIVLPTFALWAILYAIKTKNIKLFFLAPLIEIFMMYWHGGLTNIAIGFFVMSSLYVLIFERKDKNSVLFLLFLLVPLIHIGLLYQIIVLAVLYGAIFNYYEKIELNLNYLLIGIGTAFIILIGLPWISHVLSNGYFTRATISTNEGLKYFSVINTVSETSHIDYNVLVHRISGSWIGFILGGLGYILLTIRFPKMIIALPMVVLGLYAVRGGLRFTIFAVPLFALGDAYIAYLLGKIAKKVFINDKVSNVSKYVLSFVIMAGFIYPNYKHTHVYIVPTVFNKNEVAVLDKLKHIADRNDYVMTWWDYGYPIRYYADVKTFVDGGKHSGNVNFPVSFALTRNLTASRNMSILDAYFTEYDYNYPVKESDCFKQMMKRYDFKDPNLFMDDLDTDIKLPEIKENIYYYLPLRMFNILPTVAVFSTIDLKTGKRDNHFFAQSRAAGEKNGELILKNGVKILLKKGAIVLGRQVIPIKRFAVTSYDKVGKLHKQIQNIHTQGLNVVYMKSYGKWLIMDDFYFNSAYIQLFVFENTDGLFEPVELTPYVKVYKVKK
jgi:undecaprenyl-diphosphooligosaccharide--protein glycosyltransferase